MSLLRFQGSGLKVSGPTLNFHQNKNHRTSSGQHAPASRFQSAYIHSVKMKSTNDTIIVLFVARHATDARSRSLQGDTWRDLGSAGEGAPWCWCRRIGPARQVVGAARRWTRSTGSARRSGRPPSLPDLCTAAAPALAPRPPSAPALRWHPPPPCWRPAASPPQRAARSWWWCPRSVHMCIIQSRNKSQQGRCLKHCTAHRLCSL